MNSYRYSLPLFILELKSSYGAKQSKSYLESDCTQITITGKIPPTQVTKEVHVTVKHFYIGYCAVYPPSMTMACPVIPCD